MTQADESTIRLRCPQCFERLKAPAALAGTGRRCPRCQCVFRVPEKSRDSVNRHGGPRELYEMDDRALIPTSTTPPSDRPSYILVTCPTCNTRIHAAADQLGQAINCPDCDTQTFVLPPEPSEPKSQETAPNDAVDEYALADEVEHAPGEVLPAEQTFFPVHCPTCNTLMKFSEEQVGQQAVCPDCLVPLTVPPAPEGRVERDTADERAGRTGRYSVEERPPGSAGDREYILAVCPVCSTRLHPTFDQVGRQIVCPDCEKPFVVQPPKQRPPARRAKAYDPDEAAKAPRMRFVDDYRRLGKDGEISAAEQPEPVGRTRLRRSNVPDRPLLSGVFTFPFYPGCWPRWIGLSAWLMAAMYLLQIAAAFHAGNAAERFIAVMGTAFAFMIGVFASAVAMVHGMSILRETAVGQDEVEDWPDAMFLDWIGECFYVLVAVSVAVLPGVGLFGLLGQYTGEAGTSIVLVTMFLFTPIILISMLEKNSPLSILSWPVVRSLGYCWWAWIKFFLITFLLFGVAGFSSIAALRHIPYLGAALAVMVMMAAMMIYFRLMGRLAWCCQRKSELDNLAAEDDENEDGEEDDDGGLANGD